MKQFKNILYVCEGSVVQAPALARSVSLAENNQADLMIIDVVPDITAGIGMPPGGPTPTESHSAMVNERRAELESLVEPYKQRLTIQIDVRVGTLFLEVIRAVMRNQRDPATVLTPHPGEMARLAGRPTPEVQSNRPETAAALARQTGALVVLKGERTLVAEPSGRAAVAAAGNPGMATGGPGDVLAGVLGSLLARHGALLSATAAVVVHGRAGDLAARERGEEGLTAGDVVEALPAAIDSVRRAGGGGRSAS